MEFFSLRVPGAIYSGEKSIMQLPNLLNGAKNVALFTDKGVTGAGLLRIPLDLLNDAGINVRTFDNLPTEPTVYQAADIISNFRSFHADFIIALGGGSVLDVAKLASVLDTDEYTIFDLLDTPALAHKCVSTIMIPTTAGTGAEATPNAIVTVPEKSMKVGIVNPAMIADAVLLDPEMLRRLPRKIAAATGIDALSHAIECYTSKKATPFSDMFALESFRLIERSIERSCDDSMEDMSAKADMLLASFYAGVAIAASGTTAVHALSYPLGGRYHIAHGISNAILLLPVMRFNEPACNTRFAAVYDFIRPGGKEVTISSKSSWLLCRMEEIVQNVGIIPSLRPHGIGPSELEALVEAGLGVTRLLDNNLRLITPNDARRIYMEIL